MNTRFDDVLEPALVLATAMLFGLSLLVDIGLSQRPFADQSQLSAQHLAAGQMASVRKQA